MTKRLRLEPEVKAFALELNEDYKRMKNVIPNSDKEALMAAIIKVADRWARRSDVSH